MSSSKTPSPRKPRPKQATPARGPRLPHERDEASDSEEASASQREVGQKAHDDVVAGQVDTSVGPVTDRTYRRLK